MPNATDRASRYSFWQQQVRAWQASGQSQRAFCRGNDLNYARFGYWARKLRQASEPPASQPPKSGFVPVALKPSSAVSGLHLVLPDGLEIRGINDNNLSLVQQLLGTLS